MVSTGKDRSREIFNKPLISKQHVILKLKTVRNTEFNSIVFPSKRIYMNVFI